MTAEPAKQNGVTAMLNKLGDVEGKVDQHTITLEKIQKTQDTHTVLFQELMIKIDQAMQAKAASAAKKSSGTAAKASSARAAPKSFPTTAMLFWQAAYKENKTAFLQKYFGASAEAVNKEVMDDPRINGLSGPAKLNTEFNEIWRTHIHQKSLHETAKREFVEAKAQYDAELLRHETALETAVTQPPTPTPVTKPVSP